MRKVVALILALAIATIILVACSTTSTECRPTDDTMPTVETTIPESSETTSPPETETVPPTETTPVHEHSFTSTVKQEAACELPEITTYVCECGEAYEEETASALEHQYEKKTIDATYTSMGYDEYTCSVCAHSYKDNYKEIIPHDHNYKDKVTKPSCTSQGFTTHTCSLCG